MFDLGQFIADLRAAAHRAVLSGVEIRQTGLVGKINCLKIGYQSLQWLAAGFELHRDRDHQSNAIGPKFISVLCDCVVFLVE